MLVYLIRHGETQWNVEDRVQGNSDSPLSPRGQAQVQRLADRMRAEGVTRLYTSDLPRAYATAAAIAEPSRLPVVVHRDLREIHLGEWEGRTPEEINRHYDGAFDRWKTAPSSIAIPGSEGLPQFRQRIRQVMETLLRHTPAGPIAVITHGGVIASLLAQLLDADFDLLLPRLRLDNGGVSIVDFNHGFHVIHTINDLRHLAA